MVGNYRNDWTVNTGLGGWLLPELLDGFYRFYWTVNTGLSGWYLPEYAGYIGK
ncbi:MAG: hypothetical protein HOD92_08250 [Deltaproteobacteria bacterium]|nr:hypothetical protein [Deltaproteobacteria bacterium]